MKTLKDKLILAGPLLNKNGKPKGSVLVIKFDNKKNLKDFLKKILTKKLIFLKVFRLKNLKECFKNLMYLNNKLVY